MKNALLILITFFTIMSEAQDQKQPIPQISVSGEGRIKVTPDEALITVSIETKGNKAIDVKRENDVSVAKVLDFVKKMKLPKENVMTNRISLNPNYDYEKKKHSYIANQTIVICLKDLSKYDELAEGLVDNGVNRIDNVEFKSSKLAIHQSDARKLAMKDAKLKAEDYVSVLDQKLGKVLLINDQSQSYYPQMVMYKAVAASMDADGGGGNRQTLAIGEIEIVANVQVAFILN
jgi:uncharacterized protein